MSSSDQKSPGFTVNDRRSFTAPAEAGPAPVPSPSTDAAPAAPPQKASAPAATKLPPVDFVTFVMSLGSAVVMDLGEVEDPASGKSERDLPMAKHTIDILSMLQEKTRSNLTTQEAGILETLLYDLRLRYVAATKR